jgi:glycosyltransferase involved in cell wall biosynthesis
MSLRVLHVLESLAPGGMETTFLNVLRSFRGSTDPEESANRHDVLAFAGGALEARYAETADRLVVASDSPTIASCIAADYDVIHILFERCAYRLLPALLAGRSTPVVYGKGYDMGGMYRLNEGLEWQADHAMLAACDRITFTTPDLARGFPLPPGRTDVLRKAADTRAFSALAAPDASTRRRILCVANLHPRKRLGDLILALRQVHRHLPDAELRFVGAGTPDEMSRLAAVADAAQIREAVSFAGQVEDVTVEMAQARVVALPSSCEGVPTALLEAMAAGRPVVSTRVGHVASIIDDGMEGFLVNVGDVAALADRLTRLLSDAALAARMSIAARARAERHDVRHVAAELLTILRNAAASAFVIGES